MDQILNLNAAHPPKDRYITIQLFGSTTDTHLDPREATSADILAWCNQLSATGLRAATVHQRLAALSSFYGYAVRQGLLPLNPADPVPRPEIQPHTRAFALPPDQVRALLHAVSHNTRQGKRDYALLLTLLIPALLLDALRDFLQENGQLASVRPEDHIFTPLSFQAP